VVADHGSDYITTYKKGNEKEMKREKERKTNNK